MRDYKQHKCPVCSWELDSQFSLGKHFKTHEDIEVGSTLEQILYAVYKYNLMCEAQEILQNKGGQRY